MIRGSYYGVITQDDLDEECYNLACRAIAAFKFPRISTAYTTFLAVRTDNNTLEQVSNDNPDGIKHAYFNEELTPAEIEVIIAWMKVYWCEELISNADNFEDMYTDANIKAFSRANSVAQNRRMMEDFRNNARDLENRYSRVNALRNPSMGDINEDE